MSGIIRTIKAKDDNNVEQNIFPKTVLEAVVDSETNETLDVILDNLNEKIDNIEPGGGGGGTTYELSRTDDTITLTGGDGSSSEVDVSDKVSKSGDTMTGDLTVKANVNIPLLSDNSDTTIVTVPTAGTVQLSDSTQGITDVLTSYKSFIGSVFEKNVWHNLISARHRNGVGDGAKYGMYLKAPLTRDGNLVWNKQHGTDTWSGERTILDSNNYTNYVKPKIRGIAEQKYDASVWGTAGYVVLAKIWINGTFMSGANIAFTLTSFGDKERAESKIIVRPTNVGTASSTNVGEVATFGTPSIYYIVTQDTSANTATIELIAYKAAYEQFAITHVSTPAWFLDRATVSFPMTFETSLRSGAVAATSYTILDSDNYKNYLHDRLSHFISTSTDTVNVNNNVTNAIGHTYATLFGQNDGALYTQAYSDKYIHEIFGDYITGQIAVRGKNNGTWQSWRTVLDSGNYSSYALPKAGGTMTGDITFNNDKGIKGSNGNVFLARSASTVNLASIAGKYPIYVGGHPSINTDVTYLRGYNLYFHSDQQFIISNRSIAVHSDKRVKTNESLLVDEIEKYNQFFNNLQPRKYNYIRDEEGEAKSTGFFAQEVHQALLDAGLSLNDFGGLYTKEAFIEGQAEGDDEAVWYEDFYSLAYTEFIPIIVAKIQYLEKMYNTKLEEIQNDYNSKLQSLEEKINKLEEAKV